MLKTILHSLSIWIVVLPAITGAINYKRLNNDSRWIFILTLAAFPPQFLTPIINKETFWLSISYNLYTPIEFSILYLLFRKKMVSSFHRRWLFISLMLYVIITLGIVLQQGIGDGFLNILACVNNIIYMTWILLFLKEQYDADNDLIHSSTPFTWYLLAFLIYAPCTLLSTALYHYVRDPVNRDLFGITLINDICNIWMYICFTAGLSIRQQHQTTG
ncbi:hypothetical protein [Chitinophaga vietnamensis]|uniref:hypothetical protein n=1 Tax=Chitinophaga vietnamensis TaxID=2593957 RepID=UPI001177BF11|nr:hypothetical protein [Chitinophaga vietnamensis]